eukprot:c19556_g1_i1 orf=284-985(-)
MARISALLVVLLALCVAASPALARKPSRRLNYGGYSGGSSPSSGSSPVISSPSPVVSTPSPVVSDSPPYSSTPSGSSPSSSTPSSTPTISIPPVTSSPSPVVIPPVTSSPSGGYGGYGSRSGRGTSGFFGRNPGSVPRILSLVSTLAKLFGPRLLKFFSGHKPPTLLGALKDVSPMPIPSLAREGSASLINSYAVKDFPLTSSQVISQFNDALESPEVAAQQALKFQQLNEGV